MKNTSLPCLAAITLIFVCFLLTPQVYAQDGNSSEIQFKGLWYNNDLGNAVAIDGNTAMVGESGAGGSYMPARPGAGRVQVYEFQNGEWVYSQTIASSGEEYYAAGASVALKGNTAMVGVRNRGAVWVYTKSGGSWQFVQELVSADVPYTGAFGHSVAISGNLAIIGASSTTVNGSSLAGAAYIFEYQNGSWEQVDKLASNDLSTSDQFGWDVDITGSYAVATAPGNSFNSGSAYIFKFDDWTGSWEETNEIAGVGGDAVAIAANLGVVAIGDKDRFPDGKTYIYRVTSFGTVSAETELVPDNQYETVFFGQDLSYANRQLLIGAFYDDSNDAGGAYLFKKGSGTSWNQVTNLTPELSQSSTAFGRKVALSDQHALVGAPDYDNGLYGNSGAAYFYQAPFLSIGEPAQNDLCTTYSSIDISSNATALSWQPLLDDDGDLLAEIHTNGQWVGEVTPTVYQDSDDTATDAQGNAQVRRHLEIDVENTFANPVSVRIYLLAAEVDDFLAANPELIDANDLQLAKVDAACAPTYQNNGNAIDPQVSKFGAHYILTFSVNSFSTFYPVKPASILPVRLTSFTAQLTNEKQVQLRWTTHSERNNEGFQIERSSDSQEFEPVGWMPGQGDTNNPQTYTYLDNPERGGTLYYRLRQQDYSGEYAYSDIRSLQLPFPQNHIIFHGGNPFLSDQLSFSVLDEHNLNSWQLYSSTGQLMKSGRLSTAREDYQIEASTFPTGIYVLRFLSEQSNRSLTYKLIIGSKAF